MRVHLTAALLAIASVFLGSGEGRCQTFPTRPVTLLVAFAAGGGTDVAMRALARATEKHLGQPIVIENRPGAAGALAAMQMAATASPDGYTIAQTPLSVFRTPFLRKTTFDPVRDLTFVIGVSGYMFGVVVRDDAPWQTFIDFIADAKANPGKITYGTSAAGGGQHIAMEQIAKMKGIVWTHVPFKGGPEPLNALLGGHIHANVDGNQWAPLVDEGKLRLLVTFGTDRTRKWPNVPTLKELGIDIVVNAPYGFAGPKGMPPHVVKILHDAFKRGMEEPEFIAALATFDKERWYQSSEDYSDYAVRTLAEQKQIVEELGLRQD